MPYGDGVSLCYRCRAVPAKYGNGMCQLCNRERQRIFREERRRGMKRRHPPNHATISPSNLDLAWAAGFIEGEGCISIRHHSAMVSASQVEWEPIAKLVRWFGGSVNPVKTRSPRHTPSIHWAASGARARGIILTLYPWMSPKRKRRMEEVLRAGY